MKMKLDTTVEQNNLNIVYEEILEKIEEIEQIDIKEDVFLETSAILSLLVSAKISNKEIEIPLIDDENFIVKSLGNISIEYSEV